MDYIGIHWIFEPIPAMFSNVFQLVGFFFLFLGIPVEFGQISISGSREDVV